MEKYINYFLPESIDGIDMVNSLPRIENEANYARLLLEFCNKHQPNIRKMINLYSKHNLTDLKTEIHSIKGLSATLGMFYVASSARELENCLASNTDSKGKFDDFIAILSETIDSISASVVYEYKKSTDTVTTCDKKELFSLIETLITSLDHHRFISDEIIEQMFRCMKTELNNDDVFYELVISIKQMKFKKSLDILLQVKEYLHKKVAI